MLFIDEFYWKGLCLYRHRKVEPVAELIPDQKFPKLYRVSIPGKSLSDMVNLTMAKDAAQYLVRAYSKGGYAV